MGSERERERGEEGERGEREGNGRQGWTGNAHSNQQKKAISVCAVVVKRVRQSLGGR